MRRHLIYQLGDGGGRISAPADLHRFGRALELMREGLDFPRCMQIAKDAGFAGVFSIEAGGRGDPYEEVQGIVDALVNNL